MAPSRHPAPYAYEQLEPGDALRTLGFTPRILPATDIPHHTALLHHNLCPQPRAQDLALRQAEQHRSEHGTPCFFVWQGEIWSFLLIIKQNNPEASSTGGGVNYLLLLNTPQWYSFGKAALLAHSTYGMCLLPRSMSHFWESSPAPWLCHGTAERGPISSRCCWGSAATSAFGQVRQRGLSAASHRILLLAFCDHTDLPAAMPEAGGRGVMPSSPFRLACPTSGKPPTAQPYRTAFSPNLFSLFLFQLG